MKKLLHERLRECSRKEHVLELIEFPDNGLWEDFAERFADEIERYYIPRPRFEDGEPVRFGDEIDFAGTELSVKRFSYTDDGYVTVSGVGIGQRHLLNEPFKRPQPKVFDADGVEIKVGDTVWKNGISQDKAHVETIHDDGTITVRFFDGMVGNLHSPLEYTHKEPDSLEKLRDDMASWNDLRMKTFCMEWIDRLSALIERGA